MVEPLGLAVVLGAQHTGVQEHQQDDEPEHGLQVTGDRWLSQVTGGKDR